MISQKWGVVLTSLSLFLVMTQFQNCAAPPAGEFAVMGADSEVRVTDRWASEKVAFLEKNLVLPDEAPGLFVDGLCADSINNERFNWKVNRGSEVYLRGETLCEMGGFRLDIVDLGNLSCDVDYELKVSSFTGASDVMVFRRQCSLNDI